MTLNPQHQMRFSGQLHSRLYTKVLCNTHFSIRNKLLDKMEKTGMLRNSNFSVTLTNQLDRSIKS
jgi:hypothetical protein